MESSENLTHTKTDAFSKRLPLEYWESGRSVHGGLLGNVSMDGVLVYSTKALPPGTELNVNIFYPDGFKFESIRIAGRISWATPHSETNWQGFKYGLEFTESVAWEDHDKLRELTREAPWGNKA